MEKTRNGTKNQYYVVHFSQFSLNNTLGCAVVPDTWITGKHGPYLLVAYPKDEIPLKARNRVKKGEGYEDKWISFEASVEHISNSFEGAELWIRNNLHKTHQRVVGRGNDSHTRGGKSKHAGNGKFKSTGNKLETRVNMSPIHSNTQESMNTLSNWLRSCIINNFYSENCTKNLFNWAIMVTLITSLIVLIILIFVLK